MTSIRSTIFQLIEQRLAAIDGVAEVERMPSTDPMTFPALHIFDQAHSTEASEPGVSRYTLPIGIDGYVEQEGGAAAHDALIDLHAATVAALLTEPPLDGLVETIDEGDLRITIAPLADASRLSFSLDLTITFPARRGDPAQPA